MTDTSGSPSDPDDFGARPAAAQGPSGQDGTGPGGAGEGNQQLPNATEEQTESQSPEPEPQSGEPVGAGEHVVQQGECIASIAKDAGHFWETIWNDDGNAELREVRKDPNVLLPDDRVTVPPLRKKQEPGETEMRHRFKRKGEPEMFRVRLLEHNKPVAGQPYKLTIDDQEFTGTTGLDGDVECRIPGNAQRAKLIVGEGDKEKRYEFRLGNLDPVDMISGVQGRLKSLGYYHGEIDNNWGPKTETALRTFQTDKGLQETGRPDESTKDMLKRDYGA